MSFPYLLKKPSGFLPLVMSFIVLAVMLYSFARFGIVHEADEGTAAHIFQILMPAQVPIMAYFAIRWLPGSPRAAVTVLALQVLAALVVFAPIFIFKL